MSAVMSDVIEGSITPSVANAGARAGQMLLRLIELQFKYGTPSGGGRKELILVSEADGVAQFGDPAEPGVTRLAAIQEARRLLDEEEKLVRAQQNGAQPARAQKG
jgi:hypothetical protein